MEFEEKAGLIDFIEPDRSFYSLTPQSSILTDFISLILKVNNNPQIKAYLFPAWKTNPALSRGTDLLVRASC